MKLSDNNNSEIEQYVNGRSPFISFLFTIFSISMQFNYQIPVCF